MKQVGFRQGRYNPCTFYHAKRGLRTMVLGDDVVTSGGRQEAKCFLGKLKDRFETKTKVIGIGVGEACESSVLNQIIRVCTRRRSGGSADYYHYYSYYYYYYYYCYYYYHYYYYYYYYYY